MPYHVCYYHVVWATKNREPLITPQIEPIVIAAIRRKSETLRSPVLAINTVADHIHIAVSITLTVSVADWVKHVKGVSAYEVNNTFPDMPSRFSWQSGYSVLTFGEQGRKEVLGYIERQKEHHRENSLMASLERFDDN